jgi:hypothetical protein
MIKAARIGIVAGMVVLPACSSALQVAEVLADPQAALVRAATTCRQVQEYTLGTVVEGAFTASDCAHVEMPTKLRQPFDFYRFKVDGNRDVYAVLDAPGLKVRLRLLREDGVEVARDDYEGAFTLLSTQVSAGTYRLVLETRGIHTDARYYGPYRLSTSTDQVGFHGCTQIAEVRPGDTVQGEWSVTDCKQMGSNRWEQRFVDYYLLRVPQQRNVTLNLNAPGINSDLRLFSRDGVPLKEANTIGRDARIATQLAPGDYVVTVNVGNITSRETGRYTLRVQ